MSSQTPRPSSRPEAPGLEKPWRVIGALVLAFALAATGIYAVFELREREAHEGPGDNTVVISPHG